MHAPTIEPETDSAPSVASAPAPAPNTPASTYTGAALLAAAGGLLSACGGGDGPSPGPGLNPPSSPVPATDKPTSVRDAARFLTQATLGYTRADLDALMSAGSFTGWLDTQFALPRSASHFDWLTAKGYGDAANIFSTKGLDNTIWRKFIASPDALRQRVVLALSELCVVSALGINSSWPQFAVGS